MWSPRDNGLLVQRLYSTFAGGAPGLGLLLMRLVVATFLVGRAGSQLLGEASLSMMLVALAQAASGLLLCAGLWTPVAGSLAVLLEIVLMIRTDGDPRAAVLAAAIAGALTLLGPGRWSIDARVFGWKRIDQPYRRM